MTNSIKFEKSLAYVRPDLIGEWHPINNGELVPNNISSQSNRKIWWMCKIGHEWVATPNTRVGYGCNCPYCSGNKICISNCLATIRPDLIKQWHPTKNVMLTPYDVTVKSNKKVWWICNLKHEWLSTPHSRSIYNCPYCSNKKVCIDNCLATIIPELIDEWHPTKNGVLTPNDITACSSKKIWWKCINIDCEDHEWIASPNDRVGKKSGCPYCSGAKVCKANCFATIMPDLIKEWHPTKNGLLTPYNIVSQSNKKVWWKCPKYNDHEWDASPGSRISMKSGCPCCHGTKVCESNCLTTIRPDLAKEWNFAKNDLLSPNNVTSKSNKKVWWKCELNHEWQARVSDRWKAGCPKCYLTPRSLPEILIMFELMRFFTINANNHKLNINNLNYDVDIIIENLKLIIEYDGSYWHKNKIDRDSKKTALLNDAGWHVIRIRELPLAKINEQDILIIEANKDINIKNTVKNILKFISNQYHLNLDLEQYNKTDILLNKNAAIDFIRAYKSKKIN